MTYKATQEVVRRVMPLLERIANRTIDRARLLQYLSARAGESWGVLEVVADSEEQAPALGGTSRVLTFRDRASGAEHEIRYPATLDTEIEAWLIEEYQRLASDQRLSLMGEPLFRHFFERTVCDRCRWRGPEFEQFHRECRFAGHPVNFQGIDD